jgi:hypothetical protein
MSTSSNPVPDQTARYDTDPDALAWARIRVQHQLDRLAGFEEHATQSGKTDLAHGLSMARRSTAQLLLSGEGGVVGAFDARRPAMFGGQPADDAAPGEQLAAEPDDTCRVVEVDGEPIRVRGSGEMSDESRAAVASLVGAARRRHAAEQSRHDDQVRAAAYREAADALDAHRCTQTGTTPGVVLPCDHRPADLLRALADRADGVGVEPAVQEAQDATATLRRAALLADAEGDSAARDRLRARADEISGHDTQAGGEQA